MVYLKVGHTDNISIEFLLQNTIKNIKYNSHKHLRLLCFHVPTADDKMIKELDRMINNEKLLLDYQITRVLDCIYLQWA